MIGLAIELEYVDGQTHTVDVTWGVAYRWQLSHPNTSIEKFAQERKLDELLDLAWEAAKTAGLNPDPVHRWVDKVAGVKLTVPKELTNES